MIRVEAKDFKFDMDYIIKAEPEGLFSWAWK